MSDSSEIPESNWTKEQLMGPHDAASLEAKIKADPTLWGRPGYLTETEADTYVSIHQSIALCVRACVCEVWKEMKMINRENEKTSGRIQRETFKNSSLVVDIYCIAQVTSINVKLKGPP